MATYAIRTTGGTLAHHGIKGQKWGVRRYQNPDGTLTDEGRKRYVNSYGEENRHKMARDYQKSLNTSEYRMGKVKAKMPKLENKIAGYSNKLSKLEAKGRVGTNRYSKINSKMDMATTKLNDLKDKVKGHEKEIDSLLNTIKDTKLADVNVKNTYRSYTQVFIPIGTGFYTEYVTVPGKKYKLKAERN